MASSRTPLTRGWRRLRARWRLHRIEWNAMHAPLEPPPGYEHMHTREAVFPGLRVAKKINSWADFRDIMRGAWKIYMHYFIPDREVERYEQHVLGTRAARKGERAEEAGERAGKTVRKGLELMEDVETVVKRNQPDAERFVRHRLSLVKDAMSEFSEGFAETASGARNLWGHPPYDEDIVRGDNAPVMYKAVEDQGVES